MCIPHEDLKAREEARRKALWSLGALERKAEAEATLLTIWKLDRDYPLGAAAGLSAEEVEDVVPITTVDGTPLVRLADIPEPWATRFDEASYGSTRAMGGYFARDWEKFLSLWPGEAEKIDSLVEREIERQVIAGIQKAATLAELGVDRAELDEWVAEQVELGRWPDGDLLQAFREWKVKKQPMHGA
ncbi:Uncharacterised protein [Ectopseudomonas oleovorans]|uniref:Uncharacterized protein n=1 Tax=Ectopseudomonas oleovorans TaxID=301 RepID=A0A379K0I6_ECTOL|nr:hypothetical protein [Pseudomonas oleovorans]SUD58002.1 Uncharacterised protein [Pseudomonas oleovorans]